MAMGQQHMGGARTRGFRITAKGGIAGEERVNHDNRLAEFQAKGGMAEPGEFHCVFLFVSGEGHADGIRDHGGLCLAFDFKRLAHGDAMGTWRAIFHRN